MNLGKYISRSAVYYPDYPALIDEGKSYTYKELDNRTNRLAQGLLSLGLHKGDKIAIYAWNRSEIVETEVACFKAGFVRISMNARLSTTEAVHVLNNAEARVVIVDAFHVKSIIENRKELPRVAHIIGLDGLSDECIAYEPLLAQSSDAFPEVEVDRDDLAVLSYSSGTTGRLKAVMQSFENRMAMIRKATMIPDIKVEPGDIFAHAGPITHASGMLLMPVMFSGGCNLILNRFDINILLETIERKKVNYIMMVPAMINMILLHPGVKEYDLSSLKRIFYGAAPMSKAGIRQAIELFGPILIQGYGMTETTSFTTMLTAKDHINALEGGHEDRLGSCGRPIFETEVKVVGEDGEEVPPGQLGEIIVRGADVMMGYYKEPELTKKVLQNGWIYSGDIATRDSQGYIYIRDRKSETIISGGFNVYPSEIEQVLCSHPAVYEACVIGVPDDTWGEAVKAVVALNKNVSASEDELIDFCKQALAGYKKPRSIDFVDELPKNPNGKIARRVVKEKYWTDEKRKVH